MCVMSMVHDHFTPYIPNDWKPFVVPAPIPADPVAPIDFSLVISMGALKKEVDELRQVVADFRAAVEAAAKVDRLTKQPDCVDAEKAKLENRVADLERRLDAVTRAFQAAP